VDDILQEVFVRIHRSLGHLKRTDRLGAWVFQITRNAIAEYFRSPAAPPDAPHERLDLGVPSPEEESTAGDGVELRQLSACLEPMIASLPQSFREAIRLTDLNGMTQRAAAQRSGLSVSGMKSRVQRARQKLTEMLLECCRIELDRRGGILDYQQRKAGCDHCSDEPSSSLAKCSPRK